MKEEDYKALKKFDVKGAIICESPNIEEDVLNMFMGKGSRSSNVFTDSEQQVDNLFNNTNNSSEE